MVSRAKGVLLAPRDLRDLRETLDPLVALDPVVREEKLDPLDLRVKRDLPA